MRPSLPIGKSPGRRLRPGVVFPSRFHLPWRAPWVRSTGAVNVAYALSRYVYVADVAGSSVLLNAHTGNFFILDASGRELLMAILQESVPSALSRVAGTEERTEALALVRALADEGLICRRRDRGKRERSRSRPPMRPASSAPTGRVAATGRRRQPPSLLPSILTPTICIALVRAGLKTMRLSTILRLLQHLEDGCRRQATGPEAESIHRAVEHSSGRRLVSAACLETSMATCLVALARGLSLSWCLGARLPPFEAHAWVECEGEAVDRDHPGVDTLTTVVRISATASADNSALSTHS